MLALFTIFTIDYISLDTTFFRSSVLYISRWILNSEIVDMHWIALNSVTREAKRGGWHKRDTAIERQQQRQHWWANTCSEIQFTFFSFRRFLDIYFDLSYNENVRLLSSNVFESDFMKIPIRYLMLCIAKRLAISISVLLVFRHSFVRSFIHSRVHILSRSIGWSAGFATKKRYNTKTTHSTRTHKKDESQQSEIYRQTTVEIFFDCSYKLYCVPIRSKVIRVCLCVYTLYRFVYVYIWAYARYLLRRILLLFIKT